MQAVFLAGLVNNVPLSLIKMLKWKFFRQLLYNVSFQQIQISN